MEVGILTKTYKIRRFFRAAVQVLTNVRDGFYGFVLSFFENVNRKIRSSLSFLRMEEETSEHVSMLVKVFKFVVFPASLFYVCSDLFFFRENAVDSMFWGIMIFIYANFLPGLPSIFRKKENQQKTEDLPWYKKYLLLLLAPIFIWLLFSGIRFGWKTTETFHNSRSLAMFEVFLPAIRFLAFGDFPIGIGNSTETLSVPPLRHDRISGSSEGRQDLAKRDGHYYL
jgi:hypothetical protein